MYYNDYNRLPQSEPMVTENFQADGQTPRAEKKSHRGLKIAALCLVCALVGGIVGGGAIALSSGTLFPQRTTIYESGRAPTVVDVTKVDGRTAMTVDQVYAANLGSVVGVNGDVKTNYWGQTVSNAVAGSGFVISEDGYIITNYHVIDGVSDLKVSFADGSSYDATLVGGEEANDIAVLKIDATGLQPVLISNGDQQVRVGEQVVAIGNPLGELTFTLTAGYVSALDRNIKMSDGNTINVLQTDAAINSGNSGGPLFNIYGECIGITNAKYSNNGSSQASIEGIGFAIPIHDVMDMVTDIIEKGYVTGKPNVGIIMEEVSDEAIKRYGIPDGAYIAAVLEGSCAQKAGIQEGDIITAIGDEAVTTREGLKAAVKTHKAGETVEFTLYRDEARAKLQEDYQEAQQPQQQSSNGYSFGWPFNWGW